MVTKNWRLRLLIVIALASVILMADEIRRGGAQSTRPAPAIDLSGNWKLRGVPEGTVVIDHLLATGKVLARFSPAVPCLGESRTTLFDSRLKITSVSGSEPKLSLEDATFWSCTGDASMVPACGTAVWESKMRNVTVSSDGNTISGKRFYQGLTWDGIANDKYVNCRPDPRRDDWVDWELTRACEPDKAKQCANLARAIRVIEKIIPPAVNMMPSVSFDPIKWQQTLSANQSPLSAELDKLRKEFCGDGGAIESIDKMKETLSAIRPGAAETPAAVRAEMLKMAGIDLELKVMTTNTCWVDNTPAPPATGICGGGIPPKKPGDNEAIDEVLKPINDAIKEATKMLEDYERQMQGGASTTAGQYADHWRTRLGQLQKLKGYWGMIRAASCIPPELMVLIRAVMGGRTDVCVDLCYETAKWIEKWYPGPGGDIQKKLFLEGCGFSCP